MKFQDYLNGFKVAYDAFIKRASTHGEVNEESFSLFGRIDYGDVSYSISVKSPNGFDLRYACPIDYCGNLNIDEEGLWNSTLQIWWDESYLPPTYKESYDALKAIKAYLINECDVLIYEEERRWVVARIEVIDPISDAFLPEVFKVYPVDTWDEVDGIRYKETTYEGHYFVVDGKKYRVDKKEVYKK